MSHFTCLVITNSPDEVEAALQPFHKYECTGVADQYVRWIDVTEETLDDFKTGTTTMRLMGNGTYRHTSENKEFRTPITQEEYYEVLRKTPGAYLAREYIPGSEQHFRVDWPADSKEMTLTYEEGAHIRGQTFAQWAEEWNGSEPMPGQPGKLGKFTNPDRKWDWWIIGGRWQGMLRAKCGADTATGEPGVMGSRYDEDGVDQCRAGDLDLTCMLEIAREHIRADYHTTFQKYCADGSTTWVQWNQIGKAAGAAETTLLAAWKQDRKGISFPDYIDTKVSSGCADAALIREAQQKGFGRFQLDLGKTFDEAIAAAVPFSTFAVLLNGQWYERGKMGWWGSVADETPEQEWQLKFDDLLKSLPAEKWLTVVDCHI